jgi:hypothetical protein
MTSSTLRGAGTAVGYYLQDGLEPPGVWAGKAAEAMGLTGLVDPEEYRSLFGKLLSPTGEAVCQPAAPVRLRRCWAGQGRGGGRGGRGAG